MSNSTPSEFKGWRLFLWPIHRQELKKLIPMLLIFFFVSFDYNILRTMKDTLVMYAPSSGAEVIPFLKVWAMFPGTLLMTFLFTRLSNRYSRQVVTYILMGIFLGYFALFIGVMYPFRDVLEPSALATWLQDVLPESFRWPILMFRNWVFTSFYVMSELWSNIVFFVLFWGFANQITRVSESKRFYGIIGVAANASGALAGQASVFVSGLGYNPNLNFGTTSWEQSMLFLVLMVIAAGGLILFLFNWMYRHVLNDPIYYDPAEAIAEGRIQGKLSLREAFKYLLSSRYLIGIAVVVISYNVVINLVEVIWKFEVKELYQNQSEYNVYMNQVSTIISIIATLSALFVSGNAVRKFGWTFTAMMTPAILMLTSIAFFSFFFLKESSFDGYTFLMGFTPLMMVVFAGTTQNILCRSAKYSLFDATKEMAFVPLSPECKIKGKAAIDGVCSRLGKTGGSLIHQVLLLSLASFTFSAPYVAGLLFLIITIWMVAVRVVGTSFKQLTQTPVTSTDAENERIALTNNELGSQIPVNAI
ncbi:MAG: NTP/NDP exchange transporter [Parachlamydiaceae bacterium]|nr:NTP/NDP exchange transporter [Parachlamydiaceae bacterium]